MPVGNLDIPGIGREVVMAVIWQSHVFNSAFIAGILLIAATSEYVGVLTKDPKYDRFAHGGAVAVILTFATGSLLPIVGILALITLYPVFWSHLQNIFFWVLFAEAWAFVGQIVLIYAWYVSWEKLAFRKKLHIVLGFSAAMLVILQFSLIDVVASYMLTPPVGAPATDVGATYLNPTFITLNMHRFVGNISMTGFVVAGFAALRYLRSTREEDREFFDWMGHWALIWGFGFLLLQPIIGFGYMKSIREQQPPAFEYIMLGDKSWLFNLLGIELGIMAIASVAYCLHKIQFAVKPMPTLRNMTMGALGFMGLFSFLNMIPADMNLVPQLGWVFFNADETKIPLGGMYPWKYLGLIGLMLVGIFALGMYLKAAAGGFQWGRASRWSQYALMIAAVTVLVTLTTMGYTRETARRGAEPGYLINGCITLEQQIVAKDCPEAPEKSVERGTP